MIAYHIFFCNSPSFTATKYTHNNKYGTNSYGKITKTKKKSALCFIYNILYCYCNITFPHLIYILFFYYYIIKQNKLIYLYILNKPIESYFYNL